MSQWQQLSEKFIALTTREKYLVLLTGIVLIFMSLNNFVLAPAAQSVISLNDKVATLSKDNANISAAVGEIQQKLAQDPNKILKSKIEEFKRQIALTDKSLLALTSELIDPVEMRLALQDLLQKQKGIKIVAMKTLPARQVQLTGESESELAEQVLDDDLILYQHGIEIVLTGKYFELRDYLSSVENLPWRFFWQTFEFNAKEYPQVELKVTLYSLSRNREFIGV